MEKITWAFVLEKIKAAGKWVYRFFITPVVSLVWLAGIMVFLSIYKINVGDKNTALLMVVMLVLSILNLVFYPKKAQ